jgi:hypothetical protein
MPSKTFFTDKTLTINRLISADGNSKHAECRLASRWLRVQQVTQQLLLGAGRGNLGEKVRTGQTSGAPARARGSTE